MANEPSEIYANVRNKALEEAAIVCIRCYETTHQLSLLSAAGQIRALKTPEVSHAG